ncbi:MAG: response regulator [Clostridia bacterium]|nr:response regulator [Clostridia bacterium]
MINLLIADDNVPFCESLFGILTKEKDFKVVGIANNWRDIEKKYFDTQPDLVLLDLKMPEKNGLEIIKDLTEKEDKPKKNIIVISGEMNYRASLTNVEKVKWVFPKPFNYDKLISVIREFSKNDITLELINSIVDDLLSKLRIPFSKGRRLLKVAIIVAYTRQNLLQKIEILMNTVAQRENYSNAKSIRSTIDKTIERTFNQANDNSIFYILDEYYGEKMTTKDFINSCVLHIRKTIKNS